MKFSKALKTAWEEHEARLNKEMNFIKNSDFHEDFKERRLDSIYAWYHNDWLEYGRERVNQIEG